MTQETFFDRILSCEIPCSEVHQDELCLAFRDIEPQSPVHILLIPRKSLASLKSAEDQDKELLGHLLLIASKVATQEGLTSWRTVINTGPESGQTVFHLHLHIIGGSPLHWPPG